MGLYNLSPSPTWADVVPSFRRLMVFVDGENLAIRYKNMIVDRTIKDKKGVEKTLKARKPRLDGVEYKKDTLIWHETFTSGCQLHEIIRATYYTYVTGDSDEVERVKSVINSLRFSKHQKSVLPDTLTPCVFKKEGFSKGKGVDIQMTVDILNHVYRNNVDTILILSGDGDYLPVIEEVKRHGKQCWVYAFSSGLSSQLKYAADRFYCLDDTLFIPES
jgi:uncharacterized protein (TIGR00288 family)